MEEQNFFKGFTNVSANLARKDYFKIFDGDKLIAEVPLSWKKVSIVMFLYLLVQETLLNVLEIFYKKSAKNWIIEKKNSQQRLMNQKDKLQINFNISSFVIKTIWIW